MLQRPVDLPTLRTPRMTSDGPIIGSNNHNRLVSWLSQLLDDIRVHNSVTCGAEEYLVFDLALEVEGLRPMWARRMGQRDDGARGFIPWRQNARGRWVSRALGIAFAPLGEGVRIWNPAGRPLMTRTECDEFRAAEDRRTESETQLALEEVALTLLRARRDKGSSW